jgi:hypothetical protein
MGEVPLYTHHFKGAESSEETRRVAESLEHSDKPASVTIKRSARGEFRRV